MGTLGPSEVAVRMLFAPINPSDINQVNADERILGGKKYTYMHEP